MKFALSTNWCNRRMESGEAIADAALELGFDELELGFHTSDMQVKGFKERLDVMPIGSVHAFAPVPISAPQGYPELYQLASFDEEARKMARFRIRRNVEFAAEMGAKSLVLHAGRVACRGLFRRFDLKRRVKRGAKMTEVMKKELEGLLPDLEKSGVTLGLENLPYLEGFPAEWELKDVCGEFVRPWLDTGHAYARLSVLPREGENRVDPFAIFDELKPIGLHVNDSTGGDDHLPPGEGKIDFAALRSIAEAARHIVFEPHEGVEAKALKKGLEYLKDLWK